MKKSWIVVVAAGAILAGCYGNGYYNNGYPPGYGQPNPCIVPKNVHLVYPEVNATDVPDNTATLYIAVPKALSKPAGFDLVLIGPNSNSIYTGGFSQVSYGSIPTPNSPPSYSSPVYYGTSIKSVLAPSSGYDVYWNNANSGCVQGQSNYLGSFDTQ
jgi:hypothetical protein